MSEIIGELRPPARLMLTPGPSCMDPRVYRAHGRCRSSATWIRGSLK